MTTLTFGDSRRLYGPVPSLNRHVRRLLRALFAVRCWSLNLLLRSATAASRVYHTIRWRAAQSVPLLLPATCTTPPLAVVAARPVVDTSALVRAAAAQQKEKEMMVLKIPQSADCPDSVHGRPGVLATVKDPAAYARLMSAYEARLAARGTANEKAAVRSWYQASRAYVQGAL